MQAVADVRNAGVDVELAIQDVRQRYELLQRYKQPVSADELRQLRSLKKQWNLICDKAHYTSFKLISVKSKFTSVARVEISDFADQIRKLCNLVNTQWHLWKFINEGGGAKSGSKNGRHLAAGSVLVADSKGGSPVP